MYYKHFKVGPATDNYRLSISGFTGITPRDCFAPINGDEFTTHDRDNDRWDHGNCAVNAYGSKAPGGWWYNYCFNMNPNYNYGGPQGFMLFEKWLSPSFIEMKIRSSNCEI